LARGARWLTKKKPGLHGMQDMLGVEWLDIDRSAESINDNTSLRRLMLL
jgi:hypothetical protein